MIRNRIRALAAIPVAVATSVPAVATAAVATVAVTIAHPATAQAATGSVLILSSSVTGGSSSAEAQDVPSGYTVTVAAPSAWDAMTTAQFASYSAIVIGDPSTGSSCASTVPSDALNTAATWGAAVTGNVAVIGTAPVLAGGSGTTLIKDALGYAASGSGTGLYVSLNCEYASSAAATSVPLLAHVEGGGFTVTGQGPHCPSAAGTVNTWEALALAPFNGLTSGQLGPWSSPACSVEETFNAWPSGLAGLAYYTGASPATFVASDGATGQAYIVAGAPVPSATAALAPSTGGEVPAGATAGGGTNAAAPGVSQATAADPVNTENGDFTESSTDMSIPGFGPSLDFSRTYDAQVAQQQTQTGTPGPLGYGWTDNWATSLSVTKPVPGDIYTVDGLRTGNGSGGPPGSSPLDGPATVIVHAGNVYVADSFDNRIEEISGSTGTQWGQSMTAGDVYTIAGSTAGASGESANGTPASAALLNAPFGVALDAAGNLYIADTNNCRIEEVPASSGTQRGISMTANDLYTVAGRDGSNCAHGNDNKAATASDLDFPAQVTVGPGTSADLYIADSGENRIQEVAAANSTQWGQPMTANFVYTVAGSAAGTTGLSSPGGAAASALFSDPQGVVLSAAGNMYIADTGNCRVMEVPPVSGVQRGQSMTADDIYLVAGRGGSTNCTIGNDSKAATSSNLNAPVQLAAGGPGAGEDLYIADSVNNRIQEVAATGETEWGQSMTANFVYTVAGSPSGTEGYSGDGGPAISALLGQPLGVAVGPATLYVADFDNNRVRQVNSSGTINGYAGDGQTLAQTGDGGPAVTAGLSSPGHAAFDSAGDIFIADTDNGRIQEIAATTHPQFGIAMTAGDVYTVAGSASGAAGISGDGGPATSALLQAPQSIAIDAAGNLYIADSGNNRVQKVSASAGNISTIAGSASGVAGISGDGGPATAAGLSDPAGIAVDSAGDVYIADSGNNRIQEIFASGGLSFGRSMTAGDIYTIAGSAAGGSGTSGDGGPATSALLSGPTGLGIDGAGNLYVADFLNNRVQEVPVVNGTQRGQSMTKYDIYTIAGNDAGAPGISGDGGPATSALLQDPDDVAVDAAGNVFIADTENNRIQEVPVANGIQWGQPMTAGDMYTVAGSAAGTAGDSGDGSAATSSLMSLTEGVSVDPAGNLYVSDYDNSRLREIVSATASTINPAPSMTSALYPVSGGISITQPDDSQVTFYSQASGNCPSPYVLAGQYCTLPENAGASLTFDAGNGTYTFTPQPGTTYTYNADGNLTSVSDAAGDSLTVAYGNPAPGSGNCPASANWCETITAASGRILTLGYNSSGLVTSVVDPMGRTWSYAYSASDLSSVTDPMGNVTSYTYGAGSTGNPLNASNLLTITKPDAQPGGPDAGDATVNVYDSSGRVTSQTDPMGYQTTFDYSRMNPSTGDGVVTAADPDGNKTVYGYSQGELSAQSAWTGPTLSSEQDFGPALTAGGASGGTLLDLWTADGNGNVASSVYNSAGYATSTTAPDGIGSQTATTTRTITPLDSISCDTTETAASTCAQNPGPTPVAPGGVISPPSSAPPAGVTYTLYDTDGNQLWSDTAIYEPGVTTASYQQITYTLYKGNSVTLNGKTVSCSASPPSPSLPCATISPDGVVTQLSYDSAGDLTSSATPDGNGPEVAKTTYAYDGDGEQTAATSPDGNLSGANSGNYTTVTAYNADGQKTSITQAGGSGATATPRITSYGYDADGNQTTVQDARGYTTTTAYNADDQAAMVTDPTGNAALTCYDGVGNTTQTVPAAGVAANQLTPASCPTSYPSGYGTRLAADATTDTYDASGNTVTTTSPAPAGQSGHETTTYTYDGDGNVIQTTAPPTSSGGPSQVTVDAYNSAGELVSETTGYGTSAAATTSYCFDPAGNQTSVIYPDGNTSGLAACETSSPWVVSSASNPTQAAYQTTSSYDSGDELVSTTTPATNAAPNGATTSYGYDPAGNKLTSTDPNGITTSWTYTPLNQVATVSYSGSSASSVSYSYDANGNETGMADASGSSSLRYDPFGETVSATNGASQTTTYAYDADGKTTGITYPLPASATWATTDTVSYGYTHSDVLNSVTDFNGNQISVSSNADNFPTSQTLGSSGDTITTSYDQADAPSSVSLAHGTSTLESFAYSDAPSGDILSETDTPSSSQSPVTYTYDPQGRVTSMTPGTEATLTYGFDASGNLTILPGGATATYDRAGELATGVLGGTTTNYNYDADGQRLAVRQGTATTASGTWNGAGRLTAYSDAAANMTSATYSGDGLRTAAATTLSGGSATTQNFVWSSSGGTPQVLMDSSNAYIYGDDGAPAEQVRLSSGAVSYLVTDRLGSVRGVVNSAGALTASTAYDAWGNPETTGGLSAATPFGYAGGYTDPTGLIYLVNRYYDPATGQFLSADPLLDQTLQPYAYASGDPVGNIDPTGTATLQYATSDWNRHPFSICVKGVCTSISVPSGHMAANVKHVNWGRHSVQVTLVSGYFDSFSGFAVPNFGFNFYYNGTRVFHYATRLDERDNVHSLGTGLFCFKYAKICTDPIFHQNTVMRTTLWALSLRRGVRYPVHGVGIALLRG